MHSLYKVLRFPVGLAITFIFVPMRSSVLYPALIYLLFLGACVRNNQTGGSSETKLQTFLHIELTDGTGEMLTLQSLGEDGPESIDSFFIEPDRSAELTFPVAKPGFFALRNAVGNAINFIAYGGDSVFITSSYYRFKDFTIRGSEELEELELLSKKTQEFLDILDEIARITRDSADHPRYTQIKTALDLKYRSSFAAFKEFSTDFIKRNEGRLVTLLALTNQIGYNFFVFHPIKDAELFIHTDSVLYSLYPDSDPVIDLHRKVSGLQYQLPVKGSAGTVKLLPGQPCPDINLTSPSGTICSLSELSGRVVLIDFWASWCPPCRRSHPALRQIYGKYKESGFEILQVSLDQSKEKWLEAIKTDSLEWNHASDLRYWESAVVKDFGIQSIPFNLLVDVQGKIIAINLSHEALEKQLIAIFNKKY
jgi:thiol-disulfide isomerase/thioredoxin